MRLSAIFSSCYFKNFHLELSFEICIGMKMYDKLLILSCLLEYHRVKYVPFSYHSPLLTSIIITESKVMNDLTLSNDFFFNFVLNYFGVYLFYL